MRRRSFSSTLVAFAALVAALTLAAPAAATSYSDTISGNEYYATSTDGKFTGGASGPLPGYWNADVQHTPLCLSCSPTATITGGSFQLTTVRNYLPALVTGTFDHGTVQVTNPGDGCHDQSFDVDGFLSNVSSWWFAGGSGEFHVTLIHKRALIFGSCVTYGASVSGTLTISY